VATARTVADRARELIGDSAVPHCRAVAAHCLGLVECDPAPLLRAADFYRAAGRPLPRAQVLESAAELLAGTGDAVAADRYREQALAIFRGLGAAWDVARIADPTRS
jgi:hypothetical protein